MNGIIPYTLVRSGRKTAALHITQNGVLEVRAPLKMPKVDIDCFVASKEQWIRSHLEKAAVHSAARSNFKLDYGSQITLFGEVYPIVSSRSSGIHFDGASVFVPAGLDNGDIKCAVIRLYRVIAKDSFSERTGHFAGLMDVMPTGIRITGAKTLWGSCSGKNSISYSWRLVMADENVVNYVVVHELAHIKEHNHSPRFWAAVESIFPDYKDRRRKLKLIQEKLVAEDWDE